MSENRRPAPRMGGGHARMGVPGEKPKDLKKSLAQLLRHCKRYVPAIMAALLLAIAGTVLTIIGPRKLMDITGLVRTGLVTGIDMQAVGTIAMTLVAMYAASAVFSYVQSFIMATVTQKTSHGLRAAISRKINVLPLKYFDKTTYGDVLSRVTNDVDTIGQTLNMSVANLVTSVTLLLGSLLMMLITNVTLTLVAVAATAVGFLCMTLIVKRSQKYFIRQQRELGAINGHIEEIYSGHNVVKAYNGEAAAKEKFTDINDRLYNSAWRSQFMSGLMMPLMGFIGNLGYVAVCVVGAVLTVNGAINFEVIVAFMLYIRYFTQPLSQIAQAMTSLQSAGAASERVFEFLNEGELESEEGKTPFEGTHGKVEFDHVRFGYDENRIIIKDFSATAMPGQKVAIVGPTGAGKTTLVNLLMRFYELNGGEIRIDGVPISAMTREDVHAQFCMVLQDTWLFEGTIRENVAYSKKGVTNEQLEAACAAVGLDHFIRTLPKGYDTILDDKASLSAGQKQLLTIARAIIEDAPLLILDEATSSVDTRTEILIQEAMDKLTQGRTSFIIAHRLSTIKNADLILVLKDGDIVESGKHEELLEKGGFYAELYNSQFEDAA